MQCVECTSVVFISSDACGFNWELYHKTTLHSHLISSIVDLTNYNHTLAHTHTINNISTCTCITYIIMILSMQLEGFNK